MKLIIDLILAKHNMLKELYPFKKIVSDHGMNYEKIDACEKIARCFRRSTHDAAGRVSRSRAGFDVVTTATSSWILAATASTWILAAISSSRSSRKEFQHSSPTFEPRIVAAVVGTSSSRASPAVGNASVDDADVIAASTFFFATDGKTFVPTFNCYLCIMSQCQMTRLLIHLSSSDILHRQDVTSSMWFSTWEDPARAP
jgi:hypothetical protein